MNRYQCRYPSCDCVAIPWPSQRQWNGFYRRVKKAKTDAFRKVRRDNYGEIRRAQLKIGRKLTKQEILSLAERRKRIREEKAEKKAALLERLAERAKAQTFPRVCPCGKQIKVGRLCGMCCQKKREERDPLAREWRLKREAEYREMKRKNAAMSEGLR